MSSIKNQRCNYLLLLHQYLCARNQPFSFSWQHHVPNEISSQIFLIIFRCNVLCIISLYHELDSKSTLKAFQLVIFRLTASESFHQLLICKVNDNCNLHGRNLQSLLFVDCSLNYYFRLQAIISQEKMEQNVYDSIAKIKRLCNKRGYYFHLIDCLGYKVVDLNLICPEYQLVYNENSGSYKTEITKLNFVVPLYSSSCSSPLCFHNIKTLQNLIQNANNNQGWYVCPSCMSKNHIDSLFFDEQLQNIRLTYVQKELNINKLSIRIKNNKWCKLPLKLNSEWKAIDHIYYQPILTHSNYVQLRQIIEQQVSNNKKQEYFQQVKNYFQYNLRPQSSILSFLSLNKGSVLQQPCKLIGNILYVGSDKSYELYQKQRTRKQDQIWLCYSFQNNIFVGLSSSMILYVSQIKYDCDINSQNTDQIVRSQLHIVCTCQSINKDQVSIWINYEEVYIYDRFQHIRVQNILARDNIEVDNNFFESEKMFQKIYLIGQCWKRKYFIGLDKQDLEIFQQSKSVKIVKPIIHLRSLSHINLTEKYINVIDFTTAYFVQINKQTFQIEKQCAIILQQQPKNVDKVIVFNLFIQWIQVDNTDKQQKRLCKKAGLDIY